MQTTDALRMMRILVKAAEVLLREHCSTCASHHPLRRRLRRVSAPSSSSISRAASLEMTDLVSNMESQRLMLAGEMLSSVHDESAAFSRLAKTTKS